MLWQLVLFALLFFVIYWYLGKHKNLPPGPTGIPLLGYLPWLVYYAKNREKVIREMQKYGNIVCIRIGFHNIVFLNHVDTIKEALQTNADKFTGRSLQLIQSEITHGKGIVSAEGKYQRENRRFILRSLRNMGFGKISFEDQILESIDHMHGDIDKHLSEHPNESFDFENCLTEAVAANITKIVLGTNFNKDELQFLIKQLQLIQNVPQIFFMANSIPYISSLVKIKTIKNMIGVETFKNIRVPLQNMISKYIQDHRSDFDRDNISDFIYSYFEEQVNHQSTKEEAYWWDDEQIMHASSDLIGAGIGTIINTVSWFLFYLANDQKWQQKVNNEIDSVIGRQRKPTTRDLTNLPICEATILETLRYSSLSPIGFPHSTNEDTIISGYCIPKNATVISNLFAVSRNKEAWLDPDHFNPAANFLNPNQTDIINKDKFLPFGIGRRSCIGESLARMEVILFFISIFQKYSVTLDPKMGVAQATNGVFRIPAHKILKFQSRA